MAAAEEMRKSASRRDGKIALSDADKGGMLSLAKLVSGESRRLDGEGV